MVFRTGWLVENRKTEKYGGLDDFYLAVWSEERMWGFVRFGAQGKIFSRALSRAA